jgi:hypothetical protein
MRHVGVYELLSYGTIRQAVVREPPPLRYTVPSAEHPTRRCRVTPDLWLRAGVVVVSGKHPLEAAPVTRPGGGWVDRVQNVSQLLRPPRERSMLLNKTAREQALESVSNFRVWIKDMNNDVT